MATNEGHPVITIGPWCSTEGWPKSQWAQQATCAHHALNLRTFFSSQYWPTENYWTDRNNQEWYILVHLRVQLPFQELTLTLRSKGRVLISVMSCYQPSFEALCNRRIFYDSLCILWSYIGLDYCEIMQDGQLLTSLRFIWKVTKLCRVEVVSPTVQWGHNFDRDLAFPTHCCLTVSDPENHLHYALD